MMKRGSVDSQACRRCRRLAELRIIANGEHDVVLVQDLVRRYSMRGTQAAGIRRHQVIQAYHRYAAAAAASQCRCPLSCVPRKRRIATRYTVR
jgi:hypothetical protein